jgi:hypothetical protein
MGAVPEGSVDEVLAELRKIRINLSGQSGMHSIAEAWKRLLFLQKHYRADIVPKVVVATLLANVEPESCRKSIASAQKGGTALEQKSYSDVLALHAVLMERTKVAKRSRELGLSTCSPPAPTRAASGLVAQVAAKPAARVRALEKTATYRQRSLQSPR